MSKDTEKEETKYNKIEPVKDTSNEPEEEMEDVREKKEKIVDAKVTKRKKGLMERLVSGLAGPEGVRSIGQYVTQDIVVPAFKNIIADSVTSAINMMMFGESGSNRGGYRPPSGYSTPKLPRTNYSNRYAPTQHPQAKVARPTQSRMSAVDDYTIEDRRDAMDVLSKMQQDAEMYGTVSVADYYDLIGVQTTWTHNTYGWYLEHLINVKVRPVRGGYILSLPPVVHLD